MPEYAAGAAPAFMAPTPEALKAMTDDDIRTSLTQFVGGNAVPIEYQFWIDELARRRVDRQTSTLVKLTWALVGLALVGVATSVVAIIVAANAGK